MPTSVKGLLRVLLAATLAAVFGCGAGTGWAEEKWTEYTPRAIDNMDITIYSPVNVPITISINTPHDTENLTSSISATGIPNDDVAKWNNRYAVYRALDTDSVTGAYKLTITADDSDYGLTYAFEGNVTGGPAAIAGLYSDYDGDGDGAFDLEYEAGDIAVSATLTNADAADKRVSLYGVYSLRGDVTISGGAAVTLGPVDFTVVKLSGDAFADGNTVGMLAKSGDAETDGSVTLGNVTQKATAEDGLARAGGDIIGVSSQSGDAKAGGDVKIGAVEITAATDSGTQANVSGVTAGVYAEGGDATANGSVILASVTRKATVGSGADASATAHSTVAGVYSRTGSATAGAVSLGLATATATAESGGAAADARIYGYGVYAGTVATLGGNISLAVESSATTPPLPGGGDAIEYGLAVGASGGTAISAGAAVTSVKAWGSTYAVGLMLNPMDYSDIDAERTTTVTAPLDFDLRSGLTGNAGANSYLSTDGTRDSLPVLEAEFLGLGANDTVRLELGAGKTLGDADTALRFFGMEKIAVASGTLALGDGSYFLNQKEFDTAAGSAFGTVTDGAARRTTVAVASGATLRVDGAVLSNLTAADGAHTTLFTSAAGSGFVLDTDYSLDLRVESGATAVVGVDGSMAMTSLTAASGGVLAFDLSLSPAGDALSAGTLTVTGLADLGSGIDVVMPDYRLLAFGTSLETKLLDYGTVTGTVEQSVEGLFYRFETVDRGGSIWLEFERTPYDGFAGAAAAENANPNVLDFAAGLDRFNPAGTILEPFVDRLMGASAGEAIRAMRGMTGENAATAVHAGLEAHRNLLGLNAGYLFESFQNLNAGCVPVAELSGVGSLRRRDPNAWKLRAATSWNRLNLSGSDGFSPYRSTNRTVLLAGEHSRGGVSLGLAAGLGWTRTRDKDLGGSSESDDYGVLAYGRYDFDRLFIAARAGFSYSEINATRRMSLADDEARGDFSARYLSAGLYAGHDFDLCGGWNLTVVGGGSWLKTIAHSFRERGSDSALRHAGWNADSFELQADARVGRKFVLDAAAGTFVMPRLTAGMAYELGDRGAGGSTAFVNLPDFPSYRAVTSRLGRLKAVVGVGVDFQITRNLSVTAEYAGEFRKRAVEHSGRIGLGWGF